MLLTAACAVPVPWRADLPAALADARRDGRDVVAFFAMPGRDQSDAMDRGALRSEPVLAALARNGFQSVWLDSKTHGRLYAQWIGGTEGLGVCVVDADGRPYAVRPGPQDAPELAAFIDQAAAARGEVLRARAALAATPEDAQAQHRLGVLLLELGCRLGAEELLVTAAQRGVLDANHRLARLYALDGLVQRSRQWLRVAPASPERTVTEGYVLFKERRHEDAVLRFEAALRDGVTGNDRLRARLYLGKALHESGRDDAARRVLEDLARDAPGTTFGGAALHSLGHLQDKSHDHSH